MNPVYSKIINKLGFEVNSPIDTKGFFSIADRFGKSKSRCGIYCFMKENETFYIGKSIDVVKRFSQHRKSHDNIVRIWFLPFPRKLLSEMEPKFIRQAEMAGLPILNKEFASESPDASDFDVITEKEQNSWLFNPGPHPHGEKQQVDEKYKSRYRESYNKFVKLGDYKKIKDILKIYIENCIPYPRKTEKTFWELSCMPSTGSTHHQRYFCLNINFMEVFVAGYDIKNNKFFSFINVSKQVFAPDIETKGVMLSREYKYVTYDDSLAYKAAGFDQLKLRVGDIDELEMLIKEDFFIDSSKLLNLRLMQKGATIYSRYHCFDLVDDILGN